MADGELVFKLLQRADLAGCTRAAPLQTLAQVSLQPLDGPAVQRRCLFRLAVDLLNGGLHQMQQATPLGVGRIGRHLGLVGDLVDEVPQRVCFAFEQSRVVQGQPQRRAAQSLQQRADVGRYAVVVGHCREHALDQFLALAVGTAEGRRGRCWHRRRGARGRSERALRHRLPCGRGCGCHGCQGRQRYFHAGLPVRQRHRLAQLTQVRAEGGVVHPAAA